MATKDDNGHDSENTLASFPASVAGTGRLAPTTEHQKNGQCVTTISLTQLLVASSRLQVHIKITKK